jgi:CBS domain-containing protein
MRAVDVMTRPVLTVRTDDPVEQAAALLTTHDIASAPVMDATGDVVGMVSESDLLSGRVTPETAAGQSRAWRTMVVADVMSTNVVVVSPETDVGKVAEALLYNDVRCVPVVDESAGLTGVVSRRDILRALVRTDDVIQMDVQHRLDEYAAEEREWTATVAAGVTIIVGRYADDVDRRVVEVLARTVPGVSIVELRSPP